MHDPFSTPEIPFAEQTFPQPPGQPPPTAPSTARQPSEPAEGPGPAPQQLAVSNDRRKGKVARLPKDFRDRINIMIQDGVPYLQIIESLGPVGAGLSEANLSNWKAGGYLDWLRECRLMAAIERKYDLAKSIAMKADDSNQAGQAVLHSLAVNICEFLVEMDPATIRENLLSDADKFTRFINAMVRLSEGGIRCARHKFAVADRAADQARESIGTEDKGISETSIQTAEKKLKLL